MSRPDNWIMLDKSLVQEFAHINRPFSRIEALFSYTVDQDKNHSGSIAGYAKLWGWSRNKTSRFIQEIRTREGHFGDTVRTGYGHPVHFIDRALRPDQDRIRAGYGQDKDRIECSTNKTKTKTIKKHNTPSAFDPFLLRPDWISEKSFRDLIDHRKKKKATNTERAIEALVRQIEIAKNEGYAIDDIIDDITNRNWTGFKAEWMRKTGKQSFAGSLGNQKTVTIDIGPLPDERDLFSTELLGGTFNE